jgi:hypothetical protein
MTISFEEIKRAVADRDISSGTRGFFFGVCEDHIDKLIEVVEASMAMKREPYDGMSVEELRFFEALEPFK